MKPLRLISTAEQVAAHLTEEITQGSLVGELPGARKLANQLGVNHKTIDAAAALLENRGLLKSQGAGKPRLIITPDETARRAMHVAILTYEPESSQGSKIIIELRHSLSNIGHTCTLSEKSQQELGWNLGKITQLVEKTKADAWIVQAGSHEILEWFSQQTFPSLALYGQFLDIPVAAVGAMKVPAVIDALDRLTAYGHSRIVMLSRETDRLPAPGYTQRNFLEQLEARGIQASAYNLPDWECTPQGLQKILDSLFQLTPPTALFITDILLLFPAYTHLLRHGVTAPQRVSLICSDEQPEYLWCRPSIAHIRWDQYKIVRRILEWADKTSRGKVDLSQVFVDAEFFAGDTIGPAPKS